MFRKSILVYITNLTKNNFHLKKENGVRVRVGETTNAPVTMLTPDNSSRTINIYRDRGFIAAITVTGKDFPNPDAGEFPFKDTIVVEEPDWGNFTAYSLLDQVTVALKTFKIACNKILRTLPYFIPLSYESNNRFLLKFHYNEF